MFLTYKIDQNFSSTDPEWSNLIENSDSATVFQTPQYLFSWCEAFIKNKEEIFLVKIFQENKIAGIAPLRKKGKELSFLGTDRVGEGQDLVTDFGDIVAKNGLEQQVWKTILAALKEYKVKQLTIDYIRQTSPSFSVLKKSTHMISEMMDKSTPDTAPFLDLPKNYDEYLMLLGRKERHELRRKMRRLETNTFRIFSSTNIKDDISEFIRLHRASTMEKDRFMNEEMAGFFTKVTKVLAEKKYLDLVFLEIDGKKVAATLSFLWKNEYWLYNSGFDRSFDDLAVGFLLKAMTIKKAIEEGYNRYSFLRGNERYKYDLGARDEKLFKIRVRF